MACADGNSKLIEVVATTSTSFELMLRNILLRNVQYTVSYSSEELFQIVPVAHVDDEKRIDNSLVQIWKVKFGLEVKLLFRL